MEEEKVIQKIYKFLAPRESEILEMRLEGQTLQEIGDEFGISRERVRQIGKKINQKIAENLTKEELKIYIYLINQSKSKNNKRIGRNKKT